MPNKPKSRVRLTAPRVAEFSCPGHLSQAFLWDKDTPTLALRASAHGRKTYVFESRLRGKTIRITIGLCDPNSWTLEKARAKAGEYKLMVDTGIDPREAARDRDAAAEARLAAQTAEAVTVGAVWPIYLAEGKPKRRSAWKPRYRADLEAMAAPGGQEKKRGKGLTRPGPLNPLMALKLKDVTEDELAAWHAREAKRGPHQAARALNMFRGFLRWCTTQPSYRSLVTSEAGRAPAIMQSLPQNTPRTDALESSQVKGWWAGTEQLDNLIASAYLRTLLLTGARREEIAALKWLDLDFTWRRIRLADKVSTSRDIPMTDYLAGMLWHLPRVNEYVFASGSKSGHIADVRASHRRVLQQAGVGGLTLHGLRRSFSLLGEAAGAPAGAIAQVMGHKPSAVAERYRPRSLDALRPLLALIETHILALAEVAPLPLPIGKLQAVV